jgi:autotransporter translocation and assembly factor TamB
LIALAPAALEAQQPTATPPAPQAPAAARSVIAGTGVIPLDRVVAVVGNVIITQSNLRERLVAKTQSGMPVPNDTASLRAASIATLNELVDEELILEKAKELKIELPDADVNSTVDKQYKAVRSRFSTEAGVQVGAVQGRLRHAGGIQALHRRRHPTQ